METWDSVVTLSYQHPLLLHRSRAKLITDDKTEGGSLIFHSDYDTNYKKGNHPPQPVWVDFISLHHIYSLDLVMILIQFVYVYVVDIPSPWCIAHTSDYQPSHCICALRRRRTCSEVGWLTVQRPCQRSHRLLQAASASLWTHAALSNLPFNVTGDRAADREVFIMNILFKILNKCPVINEQTVINGWIQMGLGHKQNLRYMRHHM